MDEKMRGNKSCGHVVMGCKLPNLLPPQVVCGQCHSYSGHLYEVLGAELGVEDGMTMKSDFCEELVGACAGQIDFPAYDGTSYCDKHTGGGNDLFWSYPYTECEFF